MSAKPAGTNRKAIDKTLAAAALVEDIDAAQAEMLRSLASAVDRTPQNAMLWREYREAIFELMERIGDDDSSLEEALAELKATPMGDSSES